MTTDMLAYRARIDALDEEIARLLGERYEICRLVAVHKSRENVPMMQPKRIEEILKNCDRRAMRNGLEPALLRDLYVRIIDESCRVEDRIMDSLAKDG